MEEKKFESDEKIVGFGIDYYVTDQKVEGRIDIEVKVEKIGVHSIILEVKGAEKTRFPRNKIAKKVSGDEEDKEQHNPNCIGTHDIMHEQFELVSFGCNKELVKGNYDFPFDINLDDQFPRSAYYKTDSIKGQIKYWLQASILTGKKETYKSQKIDLIVSPKHIISEDLKIKSENKVRSFCSNDGSTLLEFHMEKNCFEIKDAISIACKIDNSNCSKDLTKITARLIKEVILKSNCKEITKHTETIATSSFNEKISKKTSRADPFELKLTPQDGSAQQKTKKYKTKDYSGNEIFITNLSELKLAPSIQGRLLKLEYKIEIVLSYGIKCLKCSKPQNHPLVLAVSIYDHDDKMRKHPCMSQRKKDSMRPVPKGFPWAKSLNPQKHSSSTQQQQHQEESQKHEHEHEHDHQHQQHHQQEQEQYQKQKQQHQQEHEHEHQHQHEQHRQQHQEEYKKQKHEHEHEPQQEHEHLPHDQYSRSFSDINSRSFSDKDLQIPESPKGQRKIENIA